MHVAMTKTETCNITDNHYMSLNNWYTLDTEVDRRRSEPTLLWNRQCIRVEALELSFADLARWEL